MQKSPLYTSGSCNVNNEEITVIFTQAFYIMIDKKAHLILFRKSRRSSGKFSGGRCWYLPLVGSGSGSFLVRFAHCSLSAGPDVCLDCDDYNV